MINTISIAVLAALFAGLLTYFLTSITQKKVLIGIVKSFVDTHAKVYHTHCPGNIKKLERIEKAVIFLIIKQGYNLSEAGLK